MRFIRLENNYLPVFSVWSIDILFADIVSSYTSRLYRISKFPTILLSKIDFFEFKFYR